MSNTVHKDKQTLVDCLTVLLSDLTSCICLCIPFAAKQGTGLLTSSQNRNGNVSYLVSR